eukprot:454120_1
MSTDDRYPHNAEDWRLYDVPDDYFFTWIIGYNIHRIQSYNTAYIGPESILIQYACGAIPICCVLNSCNVITGCTSTGSGSNEWEANVGKDTKDIQERKEHGMQWLRKGFKCILPMEICFAIPYMATSTIELSVLLGKIEYSRGHNNSGA